MNGRAHELHQDGFCITLELLPEYTAPDWDFENEEEKRCLLRRIEQGDILWFTAKVSASKLGIELGTEYLGGCCYESVDQFIQPGGYFTDMVAAAIKEARRTLARLCAEGEQS